jgi:hypothetical protein
VSWASASITSLLTRPDLRTAPWWLGAVTLLLACALPATARAELVTVRGGRVIKVTDVRYDGNDVVLTLRSGGEMRAPRDFVIAVNPDEVPWPEPEPDPAAEPTVSGVPAIEPAEADGLHGLINRMAAEYGVDERLAHALVQVESNYRSDAVSPKGAMGLMQLMPATARHYDVTDPFDPAQNLAGGLRHLRGLLDRYGRGRESLALAAYNAGEGAVSRHNGIPPYPETRSYVQRILALTGK